MIKFGEGEMILCSHKGCDGKQKKATKIVEYEDVAVFFCDEHAKEWSNDPEITIEDIKP
jgi:hypothetical protein